jgi:hypothetical protein
MANYIHSNELVPIQCRYQWVTVPSSSELLAWLIEIA